ncbi:MAG: hypothetical protein IKR42_06020 [Campylobacter sp.]|nr:hypothetical protein [Campylobacter sp.]
MENFENWNKNARKKNLNNSNGNSNSDENRRDYDKEPIIIKNPYEFFLANLFFFCHLGTVLILLIYVDYTGIENINNVFLSVFFGVGVLHIVATFYYYIIKNKCETKFTNKTIEFIINGETKRVKNLVDLEPIVRTFRLLTPSSLTEIIIFNLLILLMVSLVKMVHYLIAYYAIYLFLNCLFKFVFHLVLGGNLKEFSLFPAITIYHYEVLGSAFNRGGSAGWHDIKGKFHMVYIIKKQDYLDLQKYFSDKKHINLNLVKKEF